MDKLTRKEIHEIINALNAEGIELCRWGHDPFSHGDEWQPVNPKEQETALSLAISSIESPNETF